MEGLKPSFEEIGIETEAPKAHGYGQSGVLTEIGEDPREHRAVRNRTHADSRYRETSATQAWFYWRPNFIKFNLAVGFEIDWTPHKGVSVEDDRRLGRSEEERAS